MFRKAAAASVEPTKPSSKAPTGAASCDEYASANDADADADADAADASQTMSRVLLRTYSATPGNAFCATQHE